MRCVEHQTLNAELGLVFAMLSGLLLVGTASALTQEDIDAIRDSIAETERKGGSGAGYAQLIGFITDPDVSGVTFDFGADTASKLDIYKLPLQFKVGKHAGWTLFVRGGLNYATYDADDLLAFLPSSDNIDTELTAYSGSLGLVAKKPLNTDWTFAAALDAGLARFEDQAKYKGASEVFAPFLDDLLLNWTTNASLLSGVVGLDYRHAYNDLEVKGQIHYIHSYVSSFGESGDFVGFSENTDTLHVDVDVIHPWGRDLGGYPLAGVVHLGNTSFLGDNRDALGFNTLWSVGYAIQLDVKKRDWSLQSVKLGFNYLVGNNDVDGYEIVFGYRF